MVIDTIKDLYFSTNNLIEYSKLVIESSIIGGTIFYSNYNLNKISRSVAYNKILKRIKNNYSNYNRLNLDSNNIKNDYQNEFYISKFFNEAYPLFPILSTGIIAGDIINKTFSMDSPVEIGVSIASIMTIIGSSYLVEKMINKEKIEDDVFKLEDLLMKERIRKLEY